MERYEFIRTLVATAGLAVALLPMLALAFERPMTYMAIDEMGGGSVRDYKPDIVGLQTQRGVERSDEAKRLASDGYACANASGTATGGMLRAVFYRRSRFDEIAADGKSFVDDGEGYDWCVLRRKPDGRKVFVFCARLTADRLSDLQSKATAVAQRHGAAIVGGGYFGPYGDSPAIRVLKSGGWLDAQQVEPTAEATLTLTRVFFDPRQVDSYEFRIGRPPAPQGVSDLRPAIFSFRLHDECVWRKPRSAAKGEAARMMERIDAGEFDDAETVREISYRPERAGTVIDSIVDTRSVLEALRRRRPDAGIVLQPLSSGDADYDREVNGEIVKFADGDRVRAEGFARSYPKTHARTDVSGSRGKWWWIDRVRANRDRIVREGGAYDVVMLGDSLTHFWQDFDYWTGGRKVWEKIQQDMRLLNLGYGGDNTHNLLWRLRNGELEGYQAKVFQILIGTNNYRDRPEVTADEIGEIVKLVRQKHPESKIVLLSIFPRDDKPEYHAQNQKVNAMIPRYADGKTVFHMDIGHVFLGDDGHLKPGISPDNDKLHLLDWGYELWWQAVASKYKGFCGDRPRGFCGDRPRDGVLRGQATGGG